MFLLLYIVYLSMNKNSKQIDVKTNAIQENIPKADNKSLQESRFGSHLKQLGYQTRLNRVKTSPGPGDYNLSTLFNNKKGITIPHETRKSELKQIKPDPWSYMPNVSIVQPRSPKPTIGREKKLERFINAPGPADYRINYKAIIERSKMPVIGTSRKKKEIEAKPGPSDYDTLLADKVLRRNITVAIGHSERDMRSHSNSPAPNQYKIEDQFSIHARNKFGFTMGSRLRVKTEVQTPADFLKYNTEKSNILPKAPAFSIKKQKKSNSQLNISPGPAAYFPKYKQRHQAHGITIPHSQRNTYENTDSVGIGTYDIPKETSTPLYSIPRADKNPGHIDNKPGPGQYSPQLPKTEKFKSIGIGYGDKFSFIGKEAPGPGNYNIVVKEYREGYTIGNSSRMSDWRRQVRPGPADYHTEYKIASKFISSNKKK